jgi:hypothetical protein
VFFENSLCWRCSAPLGFVPSRLDLVVLDDRQALGANRCANSVTAECNWVVELNHPGPLCFSCALTRTRPADADAAELGAFAQAEAAKRRLVFQLLDLALPIGEDLAFDLLASRSRPIVMGHDEGLITIDLAESDDVRREQRRAQLSEPYRTLLGHFRHEIGHYYWPLLVERAGELERWRGLFGDERLDYDSAIQRHYDQGPPSDWSRRHVSAYASMHPWEDWAEIAADRSLSAAPGDEDDRRPFESLIGDWLPLSYALNAVNRSMGRGDLYPFTLAPTVIEKLTFVHARVQAASAPAS